MASVLWLRLDAPLMSFGGPLVDQFGRTQSYPGLSLLTGLLGNALGYDHRDDQLLQRLQARLRYAVRQDVQGSLLSDFQTVDLGQPHLVGTGWTTSGRIEERAGASSESTHIRYRDYLANAVYTIAIALDSADEAPTLDDLERALVEPERPLFIGRKPCLPADRLYLGRTESQSLLSALAAAPLSKRCPPKTSGVVVWWFAAEEAHASLPPVATVDERDWANQIHGGRRLVYRGILQVGEAAHDDQA